MTNRNFAFFMVLVTCFIVSSYEVVKAEEIKILYNGMPIQSDVSPVIVNNRVMVPLRAIADVLEVSIIWQPEYRSLWYFNNDGVLFSLEIDSNIVEIGDGVLGTIPEYQEIDVPPTIINDRTMIPLRFISESFGIGVNWDEITKTVSLIGNNSTLSDDITVYDDGNNFYESPGTGKYSGWRQLKGFPGDDLLAVYFQHNGNHTSFMSEYIGKYNFEKPVTWTDQLGLVHYTTIGELFSIQTDIGDDAIRVMEEKYGAMYDEWFELLTIDYDKYVERYLISIGEMPDWGWANH